MLQRTSFKYYYLLLKKIIKYIQKIYLYSDTILFLQNINLLFFNNVIRH